MEWILGTLILILGIVAIFVIYLSERISVFETLLGINPKVTGEKLAAHVHFGPNPFGDLSGEDLWKAMSGELLKDHDIDLSELDKKRPRFEFVLSKHLESLINEGCFDARNHERSDAKSTLRIPMLRGSVESFIPFAEASRLYEIGQEMVSHPDRQEKLKQEVTEIIEEIFKKVAIPVPPALITSMFAVIDPETDDIEAADSLTDNLINENQPALPSPEKADSQPLKEDAPT